MVENQVDARIKFLRSDRGEFTSNEFDRFYEENGIRRHFYAPRTPQQNGFVERKKRTIVKMAGTMLKDAKLPNVYWKAVEQLLFTFLIGFK